MATDDDNPDLCLDIREKDSPVYMGTAWQSFFDVQMWTCNEAQNSYDNQVSRGPKSTRQASHSSAHEQSFMMKDKSGQYAGAPPKQAPAKRRLSRSSR